MSTQISAGAAGPPMQDDDDRDRVEADCSDLTHLHPAVRTIARADAATRLQAIRAKRWITHPPAQRVLAYLEEAFGQHSLQRLRCSWRSPARGPI